MRNFTALFGAAVIALGANTILADSAWPQFRGAAGAGVADGSNPPWHFGPNSNLLWKVEISHGLSSPILSGDSIFLTACDGSRLETICIDSASGKIRWSQGVDAPALEKVHEANSDATPTPVCDNERVYAYFGSFGLVAYSFDGHEIWRQPLPLPKTFMHQGTSTSPVRVGNAVVVFEQNGNDSALMAFGASDGKELWKAACPMYNSTWSTPVVWSESGEQRVGLACAGRFSAFDSQTGNLVWWTDGLSKQVCSTPLSLDGVLFISSASVQGERSNMKLPPTFEEFLKNYDRNGDGLISMDEVPPDFLFTDRQASGGAGNMTLKQAMSFFAGLDGSKPLDKKGWDTMRDALKGFMESEWNDSNIMAVRAGGQRDVTTSNRVWKQTRGIPEIASALVYDKRIYQVRSGGLLVCRDQAAGNIIYEQRLIAQGGYFASPVAADGRIYTVSDRGVVTVIKSGDTFTELARVDLGEAVKATPALAHDSLIIRSTDHLWMFSEHSGK